MNEKSLIDIPFKISRPEFIDFISYYIPDTLFEQRENDDFPVDMRIEKGEILDLQLSDSTVYISMSIDINVSKTFFGYTTAANGSMLIDISSDIAIDENWHLKTKTTVESINWIKRPEIKAKLIKFPVPSIVLDYLESKKENWLKKLDSSLYDNIILEKSISGLDSILQNTIPVDSAKSIGAKLNLEKISLSPFKTLDDTISGCLSLEFDTDIVPVVDKIGEIDKTKSIAFSWNEDRQEQKIVFAISFTEGKLQNVIDAYMQSMPAENKIFDLEGLKIKLDKINVIFKNGLVGGNAYFSGDKNGDIFILCRPFWDKYEKKLLLLDRDVKIGMDDFKSRTLLMFFGKKAKKKMADILEKNINELIYQSIYDINDSIKVLDQNSSVRIEKFDIPMQLEQDIFFIDIYLKVKGEIKWKGLNISL